MSSKPWRWMRALGGCALVAVGLGCDPNSRVVRAPQPSPNPATEIETGESGARDSGARGPRVSTEALPTRPGSGSQGNTSGDSSDEVAPVEDSSSSASSGSVLPKIEVKPVTGASSTVVPEPDPEPRGSVSAGCDPRDWGPCFRQARAHIASQPAQAIAFYLKACAPGERQGDGLACHAAALLSKTQGNTAEAKRLLTEACKKSKSPVLSACAPG